MFRKTPDLQVAPKQTSGGAGPSVGGGSGDGGGPSQQRSLSGSPVRRSASPQKRVNDEPEADRKGKKSNEVRRHLVGTTTHTLAPRKKILSVRSVPPVPPVVPKWRHLSVSSKFPTPRHVYLGGAKVSGNTSQGNSNALV